MRLLVYPTQLILLWYRLPEATVLQMIKGVLSASLTFSGNMTEAHHNWALSGSKLPEIMLLLTVYLQIQCHSFSCIAMQHS
jgi:hypothetical protein